MNPPLLQANTERYRKTNAWGARWSKDKIERGKVKFALSRFPSLHCSLPLSERKSRPLRKVVQRNARTRQPQIDNKNDKLFKYRGVLLFAKETISSKVHKDVSADVRS